MILLLPRATTPLGAATAADLHILAQVERIEPTRRTAPDTKSSTISVGIATEVVLQATSISYGNVLEARSNVRISLRPYTP